MSEIDGFVKMVEAIFDKDFSPEGRLVLERNLPNFPQDVFTQVTKELETGNLSWRPKPKEVIDMCCAVNSRLHPHKEKKPEKPKSTDDLQRRMGIALVDLILSGKATWGKIHDSIREADKTRPNSGWDICGMDILQNNKLHKVDMDKPPTNIVSLELDLP